MELKDFLTYANLLTLLCPGLVFVFVFTVIRKGYSPEISKDNIAAFVAVSSVYTVSARAIGLVPNDLLRRDVSLDNISSLNSMKILSFAIFTPAVLAILYSAIHSKRIVFRVARVLGLNPVYPAPTAWETMIEVVTVGDFVVAKLKDGRTVAGNLDRLANFSTKEDCYDMLLSETDPDKDQPEDVARATWIASGEISTLEIVSQRHSPEENVEPKLFFRQTKVGDPRA